MHESGRHNVAPSVPQMAGISDWWWTRVWPGVLFWQRPDFTFHSVSPGIEALTGISVAEWQRPPVRFWQVIHEGDIEGVQACIRGLHQNPGERSTVYRIRHSQTGRVVHIQEQRRVLVDATGQISGYEGVWLDVTRQTVAEQRLLSAAWKENLSLLTIGLAHDFNNVLAGIHAVSESLLTQTDAEHPFHKGLSLIREHAWKASQLVHRIASLHRSNPGERGYHDLNQIVSEMAELVRKALPRRIQFTTQQASDALAAYVDAIELRQVLINLVLNAADAMPERGALEVTTSLHEELPVLRACRGSLARMPAVCLSVRDTGRGIKPRHLDLLFDPLFTTKAANKGSGLGLYCARLFVEKHGGLISVESTEGVGSTFRVWLPQADFSEAERASPIFADSRGEAIASRCK